MGHLTYDLIRKCMGFRKESITINGTEPDAHIIILNNLVNLYEKIGKPPEEALKKIENFLEKVSTKEG